MKPKLLVFLREGSFMCMIINPSGPAQDSTVLVVQPNTTGKHMLNDSGNQ